MGKGKVDPLGLITAAQAGGYAVGAFNMHNPETTQALIRAGVEVWISNHRSVDGILGYVQRLGALVGAADKAQAYAEKNKGTKPLCVETPIADHKAFVTTTQTMIRMSHFNL